MTYRIGFDIGGTFTDLVLAAQDGTTHSLHKVLTSSPDVSEAALTGLREITSNQGLSLSDVGEIVHGTTLITNAIVERKGARVGLIATQGFADILEAGTEQRYDIYDLFLKFPPPLVPGADRVEVAERTDRDGRVVTPLDEDEARQRLAGLAARGIEAIAVCFLNAFRNAAHEQRVREIAAAEFPGLYISLSSDVVAEIGEYPRTVTTVANAYVQPLVDRYLTNLEGKLAAEGFAGRFRLMHSAGGLLSPEVTRANPVRLLESGPAGGGLAAALVAAGAGHADALAFDMGGTTAKACLIEGGTLAVTTELEAAREHRFTRGSGLPIRTPVVDLIEIGAGGGSIAEVDEVGLMKVGPRSAGAMPGPACYGGGGTRPTVTDANLVLGYYDPGFFLGGRMMLDKAAAEGAVAPLARALGLDAVEAAAGVHKLVVENMAAAARIHAVERGRDPRGIAMVAFGGAGPAHAVEVARALGLSEVIVPAGSGTASALGFLAAPLSFETARSSRLLLEPDAAFGEANAILEALENGARGRLEDAGGDIRGVTLSRSADMRLVGQMHTVSVPLPEGPLSPHAIGALREAFLNVYASRYAPPPQDMPAEVVAFRVRATAPDPRIVLSAERAEASSPLKGHRPAWFDGDFVETPVYDRYALAPQARLEGPAIIEEREATTVLPPGCQATVDARLNLRIDVGRHRPMALGVTAALNPVEARARIEADPMALEIMWSRAVTVAEEMWLTVCRTAFSLVISEAQDFACDLLDVNGDTLAHSSRAMPVFNLTLPRAAKALLEAFPVATLAEGDVLVTNDPWLCAGHLFDIAVVTPVFRDGRVVALAGTVGNVSDIGGTRDWLKAREVYEEGFQIPPMKLYEAGHPNAAFFTLFRQNVRIADQVLGDLASFVAANEIGVQRLLSLIDDYGLEDLTAFAEVVQGRSEAAMRKAITALPDGVYRAETWNNPFGRPLRYPVAVAVEGDRIGVSFDGAPDQLPQGGINCTLSYTAAHATYPLKCMLTPQVRGNAGCYRPFDVKAPEGSILNARYPAAVNLRTRTGWYIAPGIFRALAEAAPDRVQAATGLPFTSNTYGIDEDGTAFADVLFVGGGQGASAAAAGRGGLLWPTSAANTSIELLEARVPILVMEKAFIQGSGGAGALLGGPGQRVRFRKLRDDGRPMLATIYPEGVTHPAEGLFGGMPGVAARAQVTTPSGEILRDCGMGALVELTDPDQIVDVTVAGGAGYGSPPQPEGDTDKMLQAADAES